MEDTDFGIVTSQATSKYYPENKGISIEINASKGFYGRFLAIKPIQVRILFHPNYP
jgi:hypothetical protein